MPAGLQGKEVDAQSSADREERTVGKRLTKEAEADREDFVAEYGLEGNCSCHLSPPCNSCLHPGNPAQQEENEECWEDDDGCGE